MVDRHSRMKRDRCSLFTALYPKTERIDSIFTKIPDDNPGTGFCFKLQGYDIL